MNPAVFAMLTPWVGLYTFRTFGACMKKNTQETTGAEAPRPSFDLTGAKK